MKKKVKDRNIKLKIVFVLLICGLFNCDSDNNKLKMANPIYTTIGPDSTARNNISEQIQTHPKFLSTLKNKKFEILSLTPNLIPVQRPNQTDSVLVRNWEMNLYNSTDRQNLLVTYSSKNTDLKIQKTTSIGKPSANEISKSKDALKQHLLKDAESNSSVLLTQAMPPITQTKEGYRILNYWGSLQSKSGNKNGVYAVNMAFEPPRVEDISNTLEQLDYTQQNCGVPDQDSGNSAGGSMLVKIPNLHSPGTFLWEFTVVRPNTSSGVGGGISTGGSGVELINVYYMGTKVLTRAHVPKLNVNYEEGCIGSVAPYCGYPSFGGYDDGINVEASFLATGSLLSPGFMNCTIMPTTIVDSGSDSGNFKGVAFFKDNTNNSFKIVSELQFGWYRYVSEWTFYPDGRILPQFKFAAVSNTCTCHRHIHHAYWRFNFDVDNTQNSIQETFSKVKTNPQWLNFPPFTTEVKRYRSYPLTKWTISNTQQNRSVDLISGLHDAGVGSNAWTKGDAFIAKYNSAELNEWGGGTYTQCFNEANLINGESIVGQDIVVWYRAGSLHDEDIVGGHQHNIVGPSISCNWGAQIF